MRLVHYVTDIVWIFSCDIRGKKKWQFWIWIWRRIGVTVKFCKNFNYITKVLYAYEVEDIVRLVFSYEKQVNRLMIFVLAINSFFFFFFCYKFILVKNSEILNTETVKIGEKKANWLRIQQSSHCFQSWNNRWR